MKKRLSILLFTLVLLLSVLIPAAYAEETEETTEAAEETTGETTEETVPELDLSVTSGTCGDNITWSIDGSVLTISGTGEMDEGCPWIAHKAFIKKVVFTGGVTLVGAHAFEDFDRITSVDFGDSLWGIGERAFYDCDGLTSIRLPATFRRFEKECFRDCSGLTEVHCAGPMPSFRANCLWNGNHITIYTPVNNPWPQEYVEELVNNFSGRLEVVTEAGDTLYDYTEPTEAPTEAPAETPEATPETSDSNA